MFHLNLFVQINNKMIECVAKKGSKKCSINKNKQQRKIQNTKDNTEETSLKYRNAEIAQKHPKIKEQQKVSNLWSKNTHTQDNKTKNRFVLL